MRPAGEKLCSRWRSTTSRWYIGVARDACSPRRHTRQTCLVLSSQASGQPVIGYLPRGLSPALDRSESARPGCRTDSAIAYDRKRAQPRRNGQGAKGISRSHSCIVGTAGYRSNPTAVRRGTLRREIIRRFEAPPRSDERRLGVGGRRRNFRDASVRPGNEDQRGRDPLATCMRPLDHRSPGGHWIPRSGRKTDHQSPPPAYELVSSGRGARVILKMKGI